MRGMNSNVIEKQFVSILTKVSTNGGQSSNSDEFKTQQRQMRDNAAAGWQAWWETIERGAQKFSDKIIQLTDIQPGDKVLDIATGMGELRLLQQR